MKTQKDIFKTSEANSWFSRNKTSLNDSDVSKNLIVDILKNIDLYPKKVLEIGCSNGTKLNQIREEFDCECFGIDPSPDAIQDGSGRFSELSLSLGVTVYNSSSETDGAILT